jgi:hypothetical protein
VALITFSRDKGPGLVNIGQKVLEQNTVVGRLEKNRRFIFTTSRETSLLVPFHILSYMFSSKDSYYSDFI